MPASCARPDLYLQFMEEPQLSREAPLILIFPDGRGESLEYDAVTAGSGNVPRLVPVLDKDSLRPVNTGRQIVLPCRVERFPTAPGFIVRAEPHQVNTVYIGSSEAQGDMCRIGKPGAAVDEDGACRLFPVQNNRG